jgi:uncharacterized membrane protein YhhN
VTPPWLPFLAVAIAAAAIDWLAVWRSDRRLELVAKPGVIVALLVAVAISPGPVDLGPGSAPVAAASFPPLGWSLVLVALVASLVGDVLLIPPPRFVAGIAAFLVAQLAYLARFAAEPIAPGDGLAPTRLAVGLVLALAVAAVAGPPILRGARRDAMGGPVTVYLLAILAMAVTATSSGIVIAAIGAWLFVASDAMLGQARFAGVPSMLGPLPVPGERAWRVATIAAYHAGQVLIVTGLLI